MLLLLVQHQYLLPYIFHLLLYSLVLHYPVHVENEQIVILIAPKDGTVADAATGCH